MYEQYPVESTNNKSVKVEIPLRVVLSGGL